MSDRLSRQHEALRRWLPPVVVFVAAFAVTAGTSGGDPGRVIARDAAAEPINRTPSATDVLRSVEPLPDLRRQHRRLRAEHHPQMRAAGRVAAPRRARPAKWTVATDAPPVPAPPRPPVTAPPAAAPQPAPAVPPRAAPQTPVPAPVAPSPTFDSSGSFDSSG